MNPAAVARAKERIPEPVDAERVTSVLTVIGDPTRMRLGVGGVAQAREATEDSVGYGLRMLRTVPCRV